jgi:hypothetical protein
MAGASDMVAKARKTIGLGEPNYIQTWYEAKVGYNLGGNWAWCDAAVSYWAYHSGNEKAVCPKGPRAYTVYHAQDGKNLGLWYSGTAANLKAHAKPGAIIFFDWSGSNSIGAIDHVGIVEKNLGDGRVQTIEGNTGNACRRRVRGPGETAGFFNPRYAASKPAPAPKPKPKGKLVVPTGSPILKEGSTGTNVHNLQNCLNSVMKSGLQTDGVFGALTKAAVVKFQGKYKLVKDGQYGPKSAAAMKKAVAAL